MCKIITLLTILTILSCKTIGQKKQENLTIIIIEDSISKPYIYLNELSVIPDTHYIAKKLISEVQSLSVNSLSSYNSQERIEEKKLLLLECLRTKFNSCEKSIPEAYKILLNKNQVLCLEYSYSNLGSKEEWFKYGCFDLKDGKRITYDKIFIHTEDLLNKLNNQYILNLKTELEEYEEDDLEYEIIEDYLSDRTMFSTNDLNNFEIIYSKDSDKLEYIRFYYNGMGGIYSTVISDGYIEYSISEIKNYLNELFLNRFE